MTKQPETVLENVIYGYSERGIINSLIFSIGEDTELMNKFIKLITIPYPIEIGNPKNYSILLEQSFSDFGDADLVVIINYDKKEDKKILFLEAKVKTSNGNWQLDKQFEKYIEPKQYEEKIKYKGYSSNLFFQLYLKKLMIDNFSEIDDKGMVLEQKFKESRKIGGNPIVKKAFEMLKDCKETYYVGLIPTLENDIKKIKSKTDYNIHLLSWETVRTFCEENDLKKVKAMFEYNGEQIYKPSK